FRTSHKVQLRVQDVQMPGLPIIRHVDRRVKEKTRLSPSPCRPASPEQRTCGGQPVAYPLLGFHRGSEGLARIPQKRRGPMGGAAWRPAGTTFIREERGFGFLSGFLP